MGVWIYMRDVFVYCVICKHISHIHAQRHKHTLTHAHPCSQKERRCQFVTRSHIEHILQATHSIENTFCTPVRRKSSGKRDNAMMYRTHSKENIFYRERVL